LLFPLAQLRAPEVTAQGPLELVKVYVELPDAVNVPPVCVLHVPADKMTPVCDPEEVVIARVPFEPFAGPPVEVGPVPPEVEVGGGPVLDVVVGVLPLGNHKIPVEGQDEAVRGATGIKVPV